MKDIRLMQMERYLSEVGYATIQQLCEKFEIHPNTARSDIKELIERGVAEKKYGGVGYASSKLPEGYYEQRRETNKKVKSPSDTKPSPSLKRGISSLWTAGRRPRCCLNSSPKCPSIW